MSFDPQSLSIFLPDYYKLIFPFKQYTKWLCYGEKPAVSFALREFAFILKDDTHLRYRSFVTEADFEKGLREFMPDKLDIGAVYSLQPATHKKTPGFKPVEREFVLDIDLTDYGDVRTCCSEATVCEKCWRFVALAGKILDNLLENDFGFSARMWVFSGRRGVHCWIADARARTMLNDHRRCVAEYLSLFAGEKMSVNFERSKSGFERLHPMIETAYSIAANDPLFKEMVFEQGWLEDSRVPFLLQHIPDVSTRDQVKRAFDATPQVELRWQYLLNKFDAETRALFNETVSREEQIRGPDISATYFLKWFVLYHAYPRLDVNVSTGMNHLLKSPFSVHPKTGNIAVPLDVKTISEFDVHAAPRIDKLIQELRSYLEKEPPSEPRRILGYKHTSLQPYVENFERFVEAALESATAEKKRVEIREKALQARREALSQLNI